MTIVKQRFIVTVVVGSDAWVEYTVRSTLEVLNPNRALGGWQLNGWSSLASERQINARSRPDAPEITFRFRLWMR